MAWSSITSYKIIQIYVYIVTYRMHTHTRLIPLDLMHGQSILSWITPSLCQIALGMLL